MKKHLLPLLLAAMVVGLSSCNNSGNNGGGSSQGGSSTPQSSTPSSSQSGSSSAPESSGTDLGFGPDNPIELTACVSQSEIQGNFDDMVILKDYAEASGIHIEFQEIPAADRATQLSLILASGEVPDILFKMSVGSADQAKYAAEDMFVALTDHEELMPNLRKWFDEFPTAEQAVTMEDGKVYGAPYILAGDAIRMSSKLWYNTDVMEKLEMDPPTTTDEFYEYLKACKTLDYNGNGQADEIPLTCSDIGGLEGYFLGSFGMANRGSSHGTIYVDEAGELQYNYSSDYYRKLLQYERQLYSEGLIDQDIFTMDYAQEIAKCTTGRGLNFIMVNNSPVSNSEYEQYSKAFDEPFTGPDGYKVFWNYSLPASTTAQFMITYKCEEKGEAAVNAAITWMDHWYSDEGILAYFMGVEDVTYEADADSPGGYKLTDMVLNNPDGRTFEQVLAEYVPWAGGANPSVATNEFFKGGETWPACLVAVEGLRNYLPDEVWAPFNRYYTTDESTESAQIKTDLDTYLKEWRAYFITGQKDVNSDADWNEYVGGFSGMRLDRYMEIYRKGYEAYKADQ